MPVSGKKEPRKAVNAMDEGGREVEKRAESSRKPGRTLEEILERINEVSTQVNQGAEEAATASRPADRSGRGAAEPRQPFQAVVRRDYT